MSIEETYKGMWSSDPSLLKSLLDAGETIIENGNISAIRILEKRDGRYWIGEHDYSIDEFLMEWDRYGGSEFLIPPRPLVLEPKPLEWKVSIDDIDEDGEGAYCHDGDWSFIIAQDQSWEIYFMDEVVATDCGHQIEAKAAIHEWRTNHLKSMLP